uniref:Uncharacterized protein n=1 Tax=Romanomermis culicivorax TaxID=13658 RepID=A0A915L247_ROMCU
MNFYVAFFAVVAVSVVVALPTTKKPGLKTSKTSHTTNEEIMAEIPLASTELSHSDLLSLSTESLLEASSETSRMHIGGSTLLPEELLDETSALRSTLDTPIETPHKEKMALVKAPKTAIHKTKP